MDRTTPLKMGSVGRHRALGAHGKVNVHFGAYGEHSIQAVEWGRTAATHMGAEFFAAQLASAQA